MRIDSDLAAGGLFLLLSAGFALPTIGYGFGTVQRFGAGVFPLGVALLLGLVGATLVIRRLRGIRGEDVAPIDLRALASIIAALLFAALTLRAAGIAVAVPGAVLIASFASRELTIPRALGLAGFLTVFVWLVFVVGFSVRLPLIAGLI